VNELNFSSFDIEMVQPRYVVAEKQSARAQKAVRSYNTRVAIRTSKSQSKSRFPRLEVALAEITEALTVFKDVVAESKGQFPSAFREPEVAVAVGIRTTDMAGWASTRLSSCTHPPGRAGRASFSEHRPKNAVGRAS
jgi:hypothetical protein